MKSFFYCACGLAVGFIGGVIAEATSQQSPVDITPIVSQMQQDRKERQAEFMIVLSQQQMQQYQPPQPPPIQ